jgi:hypothetical protein
VPLSGRDSFNRLNRMKPGLSSPQAGNFFASFCAFLLLHLKKLVFTLGTLARHTGFVEFLRISREPRKVVALATAVVFLYSTLAAPLAEANFWEDRRRALQGPSAARAETETSAEDVRRGEDLFAKAEPGLRLPPDAGQVTAAFRGDPGQPLVLHLQDAHGLYSAQKSAVQILRHLQTNQKVRWIGIEGAWEKVSQDWLAAFPDQAVKEKVAQEYFDRGDLNGEEYLALIQPAGTWTLAGVEDEQPYKRNLAMRDDTRAARAEARDYFDGVQQRLRKLKARAYPPALHEAERFAAAYHARQLSFAPFADKLIRLSARFKDPALGKGGM